MSTTARMIRTIETDENEVPARREHPNAAPAGWLEVIAGSMFSGKSEELIRRLRRAKIARQKVQVFKPEIDSRFSDNHIVSHSEMRHESSKTRSADELLARVEPDTEVVGTDATAVGHRRVHHQDPRDLHEVWPARQLLTTHFRIRRTRRGGRRRHVRSSLPSLLCSSRRCADDSSRLSGVAGLLPRVSLLTTSKFDQGGSAALQCGQAMLYRSAEVVFATTPLGRGQPSC